MKKTLLVAAFAAIGISSFAQDTYVGQPTDDTWVRSNDVTWKGPSANTLEIKTWSGSDPATNFYALFQFEFTAPEAGNQVKSAELRLTTRYKKGDKEVKVYALDFEIEESTTDYEMAGSAIEDAIAGEPIAVFNLKGDGGKAPTDNGLSEEFEEVSAWQNVIDLTAYVKTLDTNKFTIVLQKPYDQNNSSQVFSKEATDITLKSGKVFAAADLLPQLTVEYESTATGIEEVAVVNSQAATVYSISGQRVTKMTRGLYIVNGKVVMK